MYAFAEYAERKIKTSDDLTKCTQQELFAYYLGDISWRMNRVHDRSTAYGDYKNWKKLLFDGGFITEEQMKVTEGDKDAKNE